MMTLDKWLRNSLIWRVMMTCLGMKESAFSHSLHRHHHHQWHSHHHLHCNYHHHWHHGHQNLFLASFCQWVSWVIVKKFYYTAVSCGLKDEVTTSPLVFQKVGWDTLLGAQKHVWSLSSCASHVAIVMNIIRGFPDWCESQRKVGWDRGTWQLAHKLSRLVILQSSCHLAAS